MVKQNTTRFTQPHNLKQLSVRVMMMPYLNDLWYDYIKRTEIAWKEFRSDC